MTPLLDLFLQPEHLARLTIDSDHNLWYDCDDVPGCSDCPMFIAGSHVCRASSTKLFDIKPALLDLHPELFL